MSREISAPSLFQLGYYWEAKIFLTSVRLDLYTALAAGPKSPDQIAMALQISPTYLGRFLDALVTMGLLERDGKGYANTPIVSEFLVKTSPFYMGELMLLQDEEWGHWENLEEIIRSGRPAVKGNIFMNRPDIGALALKVLHRMANRVAPTLARQIDLSSHKTFLDVGGGAGTFSMAFCRQYPHLQATLLDLPQTLTTTKKHLDEAGMSERIHLVEGNFNRDPLPGRFDVIFLSDILHYQTYEENAALIHKCFRATNTGGRLILKDMFLGEAAATPGWHAIFSIHLLVYTEKGQCFRQEEARQWITEAGYHTLQEVERNTTLMAMK